MYNPDLASFTIHSEVSPSPNWLLLNTLLRENKIKHLYFDYAGSSNREDQYNIVKSLYCSSSLESVTLKGSFFGVGLAYLINMIAARHPLLAELTVRNYTKEQLFPSSDGRVTDALANLLRDPQSNLRSLTLEHLTIEDDHFDEFCDALAKTTTLSSLTIWYMELSDANIGRLKSALLVNQQVYFSVHCCSGTIHEQLKEVCREKPYEGPKPLLLPLRVSLTENPTALAQTVTSPTVPDLPTAPVIVEPRNVAADFFAPLLKGQLTSSNLSLLPSSGREAKEARLSNLMNQMIRNYADNSDPSIIQNQFKLLCKIAGKRRNPFMAFLLGEYSTDTESAKHIMDRLKTENGLCKVFGIDCSTENARKSALEGLMNDVFRDRNIDASSREPHSHIHSV